MTSDRQRGDFPVRSQDSSRGWDVILVPKNQQHCVLPGCCTVRPTGKRSSSWQTGTIDMYIGNDDAAVQVLVNETPLDHDLAPVAMSGMEPDYPVYRFIGLSYVPECRPSNGMMMMRLGVRGRCFLWPNSNVMSKRRRLYIPLKSTVASALPRVIRRGFPGRSDSVWCREPRSVARAGQAEGARAKAWSKGLQCLQVGDVTFFLPFPFPRPVCTSAHIWCPRHQRSNVPLICASGRRAQSPTSARSQKLFGVLSALL